MFSLIDNEKILLGFQEDLIEQQVKRLYRFKELSNKCFDENSPPTISDSSRSIRETTLDYYRWKNTESRWREVLTEGFPPNVIIDEKATQEAWENWKKRIFTGGGSISTKKRKKTRRKKHKTQKKKSKTRRNKKKTKRKLKSKRK